MPFKVALIQISSGENIDANLDKVQKAVHEAVAQGAELILTPENVALMPIQKGMQPWTEAVHPALSFFQDLARTVQRPLLLGSLIVSDEGGISRNRSYYISQTGHIAASYDKIHLFDVILNGGESYKESDLFTAGNTAKVLTTEFGAFGLTICYDLRFPQLFRDLAKKGAEFIFVPAAFTYTTGKVHWEVLLRARAIETGSYILGINQCGFHGPDRRTYGHSMIVSPWGEIIASLEEEEGLLFVDLDVEKVSEARARIPALTHDRPYEIEGL